MFSLLDIWQKINTDPVCFGARDDKYGVFNITKTGRVKTMKLDYKSGSVKCNDDDDDSYWGCPYSAYADQELLTIITDSDAKALLPPTGDLIAREDSKGRFIKGHSYSLEGIGHKSPELVFRNLTSPLPLSRGQNLQIWYGQDYVDYTEDNNSGVTCADVYAWYIKTSV